MPSRFTVVFDDPELYRRLKVQAALEGSSLKGLVEKAIANYLDAAPLGELTFRQWDWAGYDRWQQEVKRMELEPGVDGPKDLSDIKKHLYDRETGWDGDSTDAADQPAG